MNGPRLSVMAWRNLWRNRRRTLITVCAIVFGVLLAIVFTGVSNASLDDAIDAAARLGSGHVTLQDPEYLDAPSTRRSIAGVAALERLALSTPGVTGVVHRVSGPLMLATAAQSQGAQFIAYDPRVESERTLPLLEAVPAADRLRDADGQGIVLGAALAENLGASVGRKVVYTLTDKHGEIVTGLARVSGILKTGTQGVDGNLCLLPIDAARAALGYGPDEATFVAAFLDDNRKSDAVAASLRARVPAGVAVLSWPAVQPDLAAFIGVKYGGLVVMEIVMLLLTGAGIFNTLLVSVMERLREFGILMAIGFSPGRLFLLVAWESFWLGLVGVVAGIAATALPYYLLATRGINLASMSGGRAVEIAGVGIKMTIQARIHPEAAVAIVVVILLSTLASGLYPAWRAGRVVPVESIKLV
jgi:ABC-type lipoprotein release transport system permease subunit